MSVVLAYADKHMAVVASDGRVVDNENNIVQEDFNKTVKVNKKTILGFAGEASPCQYIVNLIQNSEHKEYVERLFPEDIVLFIERLLSDAPEYIKCCFIVCGTGKNGRICISRVETGQCATIHYPEPGMSHYDGAYPSEETAKLDIYHQNLEKHLPDIMCALEETIRAISNRSPSVNENMFYQIVHVGH